MPIENRNLTKGTKLTGRYHKQSYSCEVVENAEGKLRYRLEDGREFKSPIGCRNGHHRACLRRLGILERGNGGECSCTGCRESRNCSCGRNQSDWNRTDLRRMPPRPTPRRPGYFWCPIRRACRKARFAGSAGTAARASSHRQSRFPGFARQASSQLKQTEKRITSLSRLP